MNENETRDLYVLIFQDPLSDEIDQTKFQEWIKSAKSNISLIIYTFETGSGPVPLYVINDSIFNVNNVQSQFTITKIGLYFMTAIGQGTTQASGLFGPLPVPGYEFESFNSVVYALHLNDKKQTDPRTKGTSYTLVTLIYPKIYETLLLDRRRIRSIILNHFQLDDISQLNYEILNTVYNELLFNNVIKEPERKLRKKKMKKDSKKISSKLLESRLNEISDLHNRIRDIYELDQAIEEICISIEKCLDFKSLAIFGVDKFTNELFVFKIKGYFEYKIKSIRLSIDYSKSVVGESARLMKTVYIPDVSKIDFFLQIEPNINSNLAVPIKTKNELLGIVILESEKKDPFSQDDITLLELIAEITATTIAQHRNEIIVHDLNVLLNQLITIDDFSDAIEEITRFAEILLNFEIFCILDTREKEVKFLSHRGFGEVENLPKFNRDDKEYFVCHAYQHKEPVYIDNLKEHDNIPYYMIQPKVSSEYCIPIILNDNVVIALVDVETSKPLNRHELVIFETIANYTKLLYKMHHFEDI